jgi:hypothetical protein
LALRLAGGLVDVGTEELLVPNKGQQKTGQDCNILSRVHASPAF